MENKKCTECGRPIQEGELCNNCSQRERVKGNRALGVFLAGVGTVLASIVAAIFDNRNK